jgi:hypothetical protein
MQQAINHAANQAIFYHQYPTRQAIKYVMSQVPGCTAEQAQTTLQRTVIFHK